MRKAPACRFLKQCALATEAGTHDKHYKLSEENDALQNLKTSSIKWCFHVLVYDFRYFLTTLLTLRDVTRRWFCCSIAKSVE